MYTTDPDHDSIFNTTICGVPSPLVPHESPYPTRYHGGWFGTISQKSRWRENPYFLPVDAGPGLRGVDGCLACSPASGFGLELQNPFAPPPPPESTAGDKVMRLILAASLGGVFGYVLAAVQNKPRKSATMAGAGVGVIGDVILNHSAYFG